MDYKALIKMSACKLVREALPQVEVFYLGFSRLYTLCKPGTLFWVKLPTEEGFASLVPHLIVCCLGSNEYMIVVSFAIVV